MQNKGLVITLSVILTLVSAFYLSFSFVTKYYNDKAVEYAQGDYDKEFDYLDSIENEKVWLGYTLKECREKQLNLGLDLKGGMNVTMEVAVKDVLRALASEDDSETFNKAIALADSTQKVKGGDYLNLFFESFEEVDENASLAVIFKEELGDKIAYTDDNEKVKEVLRQEVESAIDNSYDVLRKRIDRFGVVQPNIQKVSNHTGRIFIELPGIKDPERVEKLLEGSANLEFWKTYEYAEIVNELMIINNQIVKDNEKVAATQEKTQKETAKKEAKSALDEVVNKIASDSLNQENAEQNALEAEYKKQYPLFAALNQQPNQQMYYGPVVGAVHTSDTAQVMDWLTSEFAKSVLKSNLKFAWTVKPVDETGKLYQLVALQATDGKPALDGDVITNAKDEFNQTTGEVNVSMSMNVEGAEKWKQITGSNLQRSIAIVLDGYVYSFPTVQSEIAGGQSQISGNFTVEEAKDLANTLKSGKMKAPARIIQKAFVGPSLGKEAINAGLMSFAIGFLLIMLYMILYYGLVPGLIADFALLCNAVLLVGILSSFSAVLTLPGIAGIVLTMGMAVDANVLIYERIREEMKAGKNMRRAIQDGFGNAISAIIDSNVTSFLTGAILAIFGTGPIKGFAVTYMIGIISSFLTAVFICRLLLEAYAKRENAKELPFTTAIMKNFLQNTKANFIGGRKVTYIISGILMVLGVLGVTPSIMGKLNLGIDFSGGRNYVIRFAEDVQPQAVKDSLNNVFMETKNKLNSGDYALNVITIGDANQVRVSTNFLINDDSENVDKTIDSLLYEGCKPFLGDSISYEEFKDTEINEEIGIMEAQKVDAAVSADIKKSAVWAILAAMVGIFLYILVRFRNFAFSVGALVGLAHDTLIILGLYAILGIGDFMPFSLEIDQAFIAAILTVIGYSINDTVVVFDRVREYKGLYPKRDLKQNMNDALNHTLSRTFSTSMSTFVVLLAIFCLGGETIRGFVFALLIGVIVGTYSTLCVATPLAYDIQAALARRKEKKAAATEK